MAKKIKKQRSAVNNLSSYSLWEGGTKRRQARKAKEKRNAFCSLVHVHFPVQNPATQIFLWIQTVLSSLLPSTSLLHLLLIAGHTCTGVAWQILWTLSSDLLLLKFLMVLNLQCTNTNRSSIKMRNNAPSLRRFKFFEVFSRFKKDL